MTDVESINRGIQRLESVGIRIAELQDRLREEFSRQEELYTRSGVTTTSRDRAQLVGRILMEIARG